MKMNSWEEAVRKIRVFHGTVNIVGAGGYLAAFQKSFGMKSDFIVYDKGVLYDNHDISLDIADMSRPRKLYVLMKLLFKSLKDYDLFHFYYGRSILPFGIDLPILKLFGKKILMTYCGSDIRLVGRVESKRNKFFKLLKIGVDSPEFDSVKIRRMKWQNLWVDKVFAGRDLYKSAQVVYDESKIISDLWIYNLGLSDVSQITISPQREIPHIVHAPSDPAIKGTLYFETALNRLKLRGIEFTYERIQGLSNDQALRKYGQADIVLDQLLLGSYGSLAVEGMALGKPVVTYIIPELMQEHFPECPIWSANVEDIEARLETLIRSKSLRLELGQKGVEYVSKYHNETKINEDLLKVYFQLVYGRDVSSNSEGEL